MKHNRQITHSLCLKKPHTHKTQYTLMTWKTLQHMINVEIHHNVVISYIIHLGWSDSKHWDSNGGNRSQDYLIGEQDSICYALYYAVYKSPKQKLGSKLGDTTVLIM